MLTRTGQSTQTACLAGTYQSATGQDSCDDADAGSYVPITGQTNQTDCATGTYQATTGQNSCDDADAGSYVPATGQTSQTDCAIGTYQASTVRVPVTMQMQVTMLIKQVNPLKLRV